jgi:predicted dehydrogenase
MSKIILLITLTNFLIAASVQAQSKTRLAIVGLDHDHVWGLLGTIAKEPGAELVAIADPHPELVARAKSKVPGSVKFYGDFIPMLDSAKPDAVIVTTANDRHLVILRECAKRHIHFFTEKPMASTGRDAAEMDRLAKEAGIKLMVNYWNAWSPATQDAYARIKAGELGPVKKMIVEFGHEGPKEIGISKFFADWLYDPVKNGAGALMDFGCYGADWALWLKGMPHLVFAYSLALKTQQHNAVEDDAVVLLEYPDATAILLPSWDWPSGKGLAQFYGPKGSFLVLADGLLFQPAKSEATVQTPEGKPVETPPLPAEKRNGVAYFLYCLQNNQPIEGPVTSELNVGVNRIIDAAKESIRSGHAVNPATE